LSHFCLWDHLGRLYESLLSVPNHVAYPGSRRFPGCLVEHNAPQTCRSYLILLIPLRSQSNIPNPPSPLPLLAPYPWVVRLRRMSTSPPRSPSITLTSTELSVKVPLARSVIAHSIIPLCSLAHTLIFRSASSNIKRARNSMRSSTWTNNSA
jgi:hypothetical protein